MYLNNNPPNGLYITFEDESIYQIHRAQIRYFPGQELMTCNYLRYYGGQNSDNTPILMNPKNDQQPVVVDGRDEYELRFNNNLFKDKDLEEKFNKQGFIIGDIKFRLVQKDDKGNNLAVGFRFNKINKE